MLIRKVSAFLHATFHTQDRCPQLKETTYETNFTPIIADFIASKL